MTLMVTEKRSWPQGKALNKVCGNPSLSLMAKTHKSSSKYSSSFVPDDRFALEAIGESEDLFAQTHNRSEDSYARKRRCISLNTGRSDGFFGPVQVISMSKLSGSERKNLEMRLRRELEQVQMFQKKLLAKTTLKPNGIDVPSFVLPLVKKENLNTPQSKCGNVRFEPKKHGPSLPLNTVMMKQCEAILKRLMTHQYAWVFNTPVDVVKLKIPDYFTVIKQPMDLGTVKSKLASCSYSNPLDFASDVRLTLSNAMTYNPPTNDVHVMATVMSNFFEMRWKTIEKKLSVADVTINREELVKTASESLKRKPRHLDRVITSMDKEPTMTDEEKLNLSRRLSLIAELPQHIIDFLRRHTNGVGQHSEDEIEVDFDSLSVDVLLQLKKHLDDYAQGRNLEQLQKTEPCEMEILIESGLSNSSMNPCKGNSDLPAFNGPADEDEDLDICSIDPPITSYSSVDRGKNAMGGTSSGSSSSTSSSKSGSSSSDSDSSSTSGNESNIKVPGSLNPAKENDLLHGSIRHDKGPINGAHKAEQNAHRKVISAAANGSHDGENAPSERQVSPDKLYRAALLKSRFADTILKAREKTLDQGEKRDPEKQRQQREELERQQREERARLQAEVKAAEEARLKAEAKAAFDARRRLELEREAARQALLQMEKTVEINENSLLMKDLEMLRTAGESMTGAASYIISDCSNEGIDGFKLGVGINPLEQLGLFMKADDDEDVEDDEPRSSAPRNDVEEGEID